MRVAYLINQYPKVSHTFIRREILALERQGVDVTRIALRGWDADLPDEQDQLERRKTRYVLQRGAPALIASLLVMLLSRPGRFVRAFLLAVRMGIRAERPLLVHLAYLAEACAIARWLRKTDVQHLHAHFGTNSAEIAMISHVLGGPPWSFTVHGPEEFDKAQFIGLPEKIRRAKFVVAISSYGRSQLYRQVEHNYWRKIFVVRCGLEADFFSKAEPSGSSQTLVCVGRLCEQKGQLLLIEAIGRLRDRGVEVSLTLAGDGEMRADIEALIEKLELQSHVQITGWISSASVREHLLNARAMVLPSFAEGLPVVIMEALALGRPVISTYVAGIPELVANGENGWLVPAGDLHALGSAIRACVTASTETMKEMGEVAFSKVLQSHKIETEAAMLEQLFKSPMCLDSKTAEN